MQSSQWLAASLCQQALASPSLPASGLNDEESRVEQGGEQGGCRE